MTAVAPQVEADAAALAAVAAHIPDTTEVHGIADTAALVLINDPRLADARTPTAHVATHATGGTDPLTPGAIGAELAGAAVAAAAAAEMAYAPQLPRLIAPFDPRLGNGGAVVGLGRAHLVRVIVPRSGVLTGLAVFMRFASGNIDVGVYSAAVPRARLFSTGPIACPAGNTWTVVGSPGLAVTAGQQLDFAIGASDATAQVLCFVGANLNQVSLPLEFWPASGMRARLTCVHPTGYPLPASIAEADATTLSASSPLIIARVTDS